MRVARIVCWMTLIVNPELLLDWVITLGRLADRKARVYALASRNQRHRTKGTKATRRLVRPSCPLCEGFCLFKPLRTAGYQQQRAYLLELAQLLGALEPLAGIFLRRQRVVGDAPSLGACEACLGQHLDVLGLRQLMHRDFEFVCPTQRIVVVLI